jgi:eukaryotic-like serine/threonine-protein kinase
MATEFIDGDNLRHQLKRAPLSLTEALDIAIQVASALASAHAAGIIHRDIKPENIMIRSDGIAKVLDFGLAKLTERWRADDVDRDAATQAFVHTEPGMVVGTTAYLSPEQARALEVDTRTDIWSLGVVLYEMITRHAPFKSETASDTSAAILKTEPPPLSEFVPEVPAEIERIARKALQKNREERYQGIKDMLLDLKTLRRDLDFSSAMERSATSRTHEQTPSVMREPVESETVPSSQSSLLTVQIGGRNRTRLVVIALVLVLMFSAVGGWYWWRRHEADLNRYGSLAVTQLVGRKNDLGETGTAHARFSPDGKFIAYASPKGSGSAIWLKQLASGEPFANAAELGTAASPVWSADGLQIAFLSRRQDQSGIWTMAAFGGSPSLLKSLEGLSRELIAWTRSGKIYFVMRNNVYALDVATQEISQATKLDEPKRDREFAISPKEDQIAFTDNVDGQVDLWTAPISGGHPVRITNDAAPDGNPVWMPDGQRIVYSSRRNGIRQVCMVRLDGSQPVQLTVNDSNANVLDVSLDGTKILYSTDRDESDLWGVRLDQQKETQLTSDTGIKLWPDVSPDGKTLAYQLIRGTTGATLLNSVLMAKPLTGGGADSQLAPDGFDAQWSPDGKQLAYMRYVNGTNDLWMVHAAGGDAKVLTTGGVMFGGFSQLPYNRMQTQDFQWSRDSTHLIYCAKNSNVWNLWQTGIAASAPEQVSDNHDENVRFFNPMWAPDGQRVAWLAVSSDKTSSVWLRADGQQKKLFESSSPLGLVGWSQTGDELIAKSISGDTAPNRPIDVNLIAVSLRDGKSRTLAQLPMAYFQSIKLAPSDNQIAYVSRQENADSLRLMPATGGAAKTIISSSDPRVYLAAIVWSPDGKSIYYGKQSSWTILSMIDNFK